MGKNKKYKRKAKWIKGVCHRQFDCFFCPADDECVCIRANTNSIPGLCDIRTIERICRYGR